MIKNGIFHSCTIQLNISTIGRVNSTGVFYSSAKFTCTFSTGDRYCTIIPCLLNVLFTSLLFIE